MSFFCYDHIYAVRKCKFLFHICPCLYIDKQNLFPLEQIAKMKKGTLDPPYQSCTQNVLSMFYENL